GPEQLTRPRSDSPFVEGLHEVTRVRLMDGNVFEHRVIEVTEPLLAAGLAPVSGAHGHVVVAYGGNGLELPGSIHGGSGIEGECAVSARSALRPARNGRVRHAGVV